MNLKKLGRLLWVIAAVAMLAMVVQGCSSDDNGMEVPMPPDTTDAGGAARYDRAGGAARYDRSGGAARYDRSGGAARYDRSGGAARYDRSGGAARYDRSGGADGDDRAGEGPTACHGRHGCCQDVV